MAVRGRASSGRCCSDTVQLAMSVPIAENVLLQHALKSKATCKHCWLLPDNDGMRSVTSRLSCIHNEPSWRATTDCLRTV